MVTSRPKVSFDQMVTLVPEIMDGYLRNETPSWAYTQGSSTVKSWRTRRRISQSILVT
jgi:hypothetical protein